jgi:hypothetical protein
MNGRQSRLQRNGQRFSPTDPGLAEIRRLLFGDRFKAGYGLKDPAYMPLTPHEAAQYIFSQGAKAWDKYHSAEELEAWIMAGPDVDELGPQDRSERWYDDAGRLVARWLLLRLRSVPEDARLTVTFWESMESIYPRMRTLSLSTAQREWARSAALRILDAYRADGELI